MGTHERMSPAHADLRRYPRCRAAWNVVIDTPGARPRTRRTIDIGLHGAKVRLTDPLGQGAPVRLRFSTPDRRGLLVDSIVWRSDPDGQVFVFVGLSEEHLARLKGLIDSCRGL